MSDGQRNALKGLCGLVIAVALTTYGQHAWNVGVFEYARGTGSEFDIPTIVVAIALPLRVALVTLGDLSLVAAGVVSYFAAIFIGSPNDSGRT